MKILLVVDETNFYYPKFVSLVINKLKSRGYDIKVGLVTKVKDTNSIQKYLIKNFKKLYFREFVLLALKKCFFVLADFFTKNFDYCFKVESVLKKKNVNYFKIEYDINKKEHLEYIKNYGPDIIISSCSVIFSSTLLKIPIFGCINRHSALLPSYGGLYPVFHSIADNNKFSGVTIHKMTEKIDEGEILAQKVVKNIDNNLSKIYKKCFEISVDLILIGIDNVLKNIYIKNNYKKSYFSFPNKEKWLMFRKNKGKFI
tara:strand:+ start:196 stop:966 length:771 start_codon:yes stop_codon:yes gene_type:complete